MDQHPLTCSHCALPVVVRHGRVVGLDGNIECYVGGATHLLPQEDAVRALARSA